ncbi:GGDEF domain-containing protein [Paraburkholderia sp. SIMBA_049]
MSNRSVGIGLLLAVVATSFYLYVLVNMLERKAATDPLTGLLNRSSFEYIIGQVVGKPSEHYSALLLIDLDGFKEVNDVLGHAAGDDLLQNFASNLASLGSQGDAIARLGGDEFAFFIRQAREKAAIEAVAERVHRAIASVKLASPCPLKVTASVGACMLQLTGSTERPAVKKVLQKADYAMYSAKMGGQGQTVFWDDRWLLNLPGQVFPH